MTPSRRSIQEAINILAKAAEEVGVRAEFGSGLARIFLEHSIDYLRLQRNQALLDGLNAILGDPERDARLGMKWVAE